MAQAPKLLASPPVIERTEILGAKLSSADDSAPFSCGLG
jgi:hypothetical protein